MNVELTPIMIDIITIVLMISYPIFEGVKEVRFQKINIAAIQGNSQNKSKLLSLKHFDMDYKGLNASLFVAFSCVAAISLESNILLAFLLVCISAAWRWIMYDGMLNLGRDLHFGYSGTTNRSFLDVILKKTPPFMDLLIKGILFGSLLVTYLIYKL